MAANKRLFIDNHALEKLLYRPADDRMLFSFYKNKIYHFIKRDQLDENQSNQVADLCCNQFRII